MKYGSIKQDRFLDALEKLLIEHEMGIISATNHRTLAEYMYLSLCNFEQAVFDRDTEKRGETTFVWDLPTVK